MSEEVGMSQDFIVVMATAPNEEVASDIARAVVTEKLAACCNIVPGLRSIYSWKGELCDDKEVLCIMKTRAELFDKLRERVVELHPYDVPEVIAVDIKAGHGPYLKWIEETTT